ncbi:uncharacterized protein LOC125582176 [Brassica napus]|uniref:uncharacterized protein LOC125582176 n=1 Tax=Brassica napus TaxID=3708 RepID=UPI002078C674|nr:uncharacterized protein LOC125582176 [Brassica napus]
MKGCLSNKARGRIGHKAIKGGELSLLFKVDLENLIYSFIMGELDANISYKESVELRNGRKTSFWYEAWSSLGRLQEVMGGRGHIDMGILVNENIEACRNHRRRSHRVNILNRVELEIERYKENWVDEEDISLWRNSKGKCMKTFSTSETWQNIREKHTLCSWYSAVWFKHATPKYAFITWMVMLGRLSTGDRMKNWNANVDASCVLCNNPLETAEHLFFQCSYSKQIWEVLMSVGKSVHGGIE